MHAGELGLEIREGFFEAFGEADLRLPTEDPAGFGNIGAALLGIILRERLDDDGNRRAGERADAFGRVAGPLSLNFSDGWRCF